VVSLQALAPFSRSFQPAGVGSSAFALFRLAQQSRSRAIDIRLEALISNFDYAWQRRAAAAALGNEFRHAYWSIAQLVAHHTINGCNLRPGDLFGSGHAIRTHAGRGRLVWWN